MTDYLLDVHQQYSSRFPALIEASDPLGAAEHDAGRLGR